MKFKRKINKTMFMFNKLSKDLFFKEKMYRISSKLHSNYLKEYYFYFQEENLSKGKGQALIKQFDSNGIPINKTYIDVQNQDYVYFPISIGQMGLAVYHSYLKTNSSQDKDRFYKFVNWFYNHGQSDKKLGVRWLTHVPLPQYQNPGPWQSAFAQSRGISILLRGYQITGDHKYAEVAEKALIPFSKAVLDGGVTSFTQWGPFYEEYTAKVPTLVLNGMIFSLCGICDFIRVFPNNALAQKLYSDGIQTLKYILPQYDMGFWSRYNLCKAPWYPKDDPATVWYQRLHVVQLRLLFQLTDDPVFQKYAELFQKQNNLYNIIKMYRTKYTALKKLKRL